MLRPLFLVLAATALCACSEATNGTGQISQRIGEVVRDPEARELDLAKLTSFGWDRLHLVKPGTSREELCRFIGAKRTTCGRIVRYPSVPADSMALVFALNGQLTHLELHALSNGQFDLSAAENGYLREDAVFKIRRVASGTPNDAVRLEPKRLQGTSNSMRRDFVQI